MQLALDLQVQVQARSASGFTRETVERRLADLIERQERGASVGDEINYLRRLLEKKWGA